MLLVLSVCDSHLPGDNAALLQLQVRQGHQECCRAACPQLKGSSRGCQHLEGLMSRGRELLRRDPKDTVLLLQLLCCSYKRKQLLLTCRCGGVPGRHSAVDANLRQVAEQQAMLRQHHGVLPVSQACCSQIFDCILGVDQSLAKSRDTDRSAVLFCCVVYEQVASHCGPVLLGPWLDIAPGCSLAAAGGYWLACSSLLNLID